MNGSFFYYDEVVTVRQQTKGIRRELLNQQFDIRTQFDEISDCHLIEIKNGTFSKLRWEAASDDSIIFSEVIESGFCRQIKITHEMIRYMMGKSHHIIFKVYDMNHKLLHTFKN
jgi:hypothetical protein